MRILKSVRLPLSWRWYPGTLGEQFSWNTEQSGGADCRTREEATVGGLDGLVALVLTVEAVVVRRHTGAGSEASARRLQRSPWWVRPVGSLGKERCTVARAHQSTQSMRAFDAPWYKARRGFVRFGTSCALVCTRTLLFGLMHGSISGENV